MRATEQLGRYELLDLVTQDPGADGHADVFLWRGYDQILDRPVAVRVLDADDPRCAAVLGAAQAAARVDDRRLLRVLDILTLPATTTDPARIAVVSEWASGRNLERTLQARGEPFDATEALTLCAEVARAVAAGAAEGTSHGRLRPSSVFVTDAGEIRVRGLAVDAALFGTLPDVADRRQADVDALGSLVYALTTGTWPGEGHVDLPAAPRTNGTTGAVLPPSQVRAGVPRNVDDVVARSVITANRARGVARVPDAAAFATMVGAALDHVAPVTVQYRVAPTPARRRARTAGIWLGRLVAVVLALGMVAVLAYAGLTLVTGRSTTSSTPRPSGLDPILTTPARPVDELAGSSIERTFTIMKARSFDPFGDDDGNGKPDKRKGTESEELVPVINDADATTAWLTSQYTSTDLDGKEGVGVVLDLGAPQDVQQVSMRLVGKGSQVDVRVADRIYSDPALWTPLAGAFAPRDRLDLRAPRPVTGRYVLIWFTKVPPAEEQGTGVYQGGIKSVVVTG